MEYYNDNKSVQGEQLRYWNLDCHFCLCFKWAEGISV